MMSERNAHDTEVAAPKAVSISSESSPDQSDSNIVDMFDIQLTLNDSLASAVLEPTVGNNSSADVANGEVEKVIACLSVENKRLYFGFLYILEIDHEIAKTMSINNLFETYIKVPTIANSIARKSTLSGLIALLNEHRSKIALFTLKSVRTTLLEVDPTMDSELAGDSMYISMESLVNLKHESTLFPRIDKNDDRYRRAVTVSGDSGSGKSMLAIYQLAQVVYSYTEEEKTIVCYFKRGFDDISEYKDERNKVCLEYLNQCLNKAKLKLVERHPELGEDSAAIRDIWMHINLLCVFDEMGPYPTWVRGFIAANEAFQKENVGETIGGVAVTLVGTGLDWTINHPDNNNIGSHPGNYYHIQMKPWRSEELKMYLKRSLHEKDQVKYIEHGILSSQLLRGLATNARCLKFLRRQVVKICEGVTDKEQIPLALYNATSRIFVAVAEEYRHVNGIGKFWETGANRRYDLVKIALSVALNPSLATQEGLFGTVRDLILYGVLLYIKDGVVSMNSAVLLMILSMFGENDITVQNSTDFERLVALRAMAQLRCEGYTNVQVVRLQSAIPAANSNANWSKRAHLIEQLEEFVSSVRSNEVTGDAFNDYVRSFPKNIRNRLCEESNVGVASGYQLKSQTEFCKHADNLISEWKKEWFKCILPIPEGCLTLRDGRLCVAAGKAIVIVNGPQAACADVFKICTEYFEVNQVKHYTQVEGYAPCPKNLQEECRKLGACWNETELEGKFEATTLALSTLASAAAEVRRQIVTSNGCKYTEPLKCKSTLIGSKEEDCEIQFIKVEPVWQDLVLSIKEQSGKKKPNANSEFVSWYDSQVHISLPEFVDKEMCQEVGGKTDMQEYENDESDE